LGRRGLRRLGLLRLRGRLLLLLLLLMLPELRGSRHPNIATQKKTSVVHCFEHAGNLILHQMRGHVEPLHRLQDHDR
jgi:hypothetical protein